MCQSNVWSPHNAAIAVIFKTGRNPITMPANINSLFINLTISLSLNGTECHLRWVKKFPGGNPATLCRLQIA